jgi:hypothetical protein
VRGHGLVGVPVQASRPAARPAQPDNARALRRDRLPRAGVHPRTPWVYLRFDRALGIPNLATLGIYGCVVVHSAIAQVLLLLWTYPPDQVWRRARWRLLVGGLALATMTTLFLLASVPEERPTDFDARYAGTSPIGAFLLGYFTAFAIGLAGISRLCWRYARVAGRRWLRDGLRLTAVGAGFAQGYCGCKLVFVVGRLLGDDLPAWNLAAPVCAAIGAPLLCIGLTIPGWGPLLSGAAGEDRPLPLLPRAASAVVGPLPIDA